MMMVRTVTVGAAPTLKEVAQARAIPESVVPSMKAVLVPWTAIEVVGRSKFESFAATVSEEPLTDIAAAVAAKKPAAVTNAKATFQSNSFKTVAELVTFYETVLYPVRVAKKEFDRLELESFHIKDDLKRGLSAFKQSYLDKEKVRLDKVKKEMYALQATIKKVGADNFTTEIFNDIANILRMSTEKQEHARLMAIRVLEDMTLVGISFDAVTQQLLKAITFGDGPFEDSGLLFSCVEYPERGEISASKESLEAIADDTLGLISRRHQTPLDEGRKLRQSDTHPMLQRSPE